MELSWEDKISDFHEVVVLQTNRLSWIQTSGTVDLMDINADMKLVDVLDLFKVPICTMEAIWIWKLPASHPTAAGAAASAGRAQAMKSEYCIWRILTCGAPGLFLLV